MTYSPLSRAIAICLFLSLLNATTNVFADDDLEVRPNDVELLRGERAPFSGVLTSYPMYREFTDALDKNEYLSKKLTENIEKPLDPQSDFESKALLYLGGVLTGLVVYHFSK